MSMPTWSHCHLEDVLPAGLVRCPANHSTAQLHRVSLASFFLMATSCCPAPKSETRKRRYQCPVAAPPPATTSSLSAAHRHNIITLLCPPPLCRAAVAPRSRHSRQWSSSSAAFCRPPGSGSCSSVPPLAGGKTHKNTESIGTMTTL